MSTFALFHKTEDVYASYSSNTRFCAEITV